MLGFPSLKISTKNTTQKKHWKEELVDMGGKVAASFPFPFKKFVMLLFEQQKIIGRRKKRIQ